MRLLLSFLPLVILPSFVAARMAVPHRRATDTCANINIKLPVAIVSIQLQVCACLGQINTLVGSNFALSAAVSKLGGMANVTALVSSAIGRGAGRCQCSYPEHSIPACSSTDLCDFRCSAGRVKLDDKCVCPLGKTDCNGKCVKGACSSQLPSWNCSSCSGKRSELHALAARSKRSGHGTPNWVRRSLSAAHCAVGTEMCGVYGRPDAWECLNVNQHLESCGGCAFSFFPGQKSGVDCSDLPGIDSVECQGGKCLVRKCQENWVVSADGHSCEAKENSLTQRAISSTDFPASGKKSSSSKVDAFRSADW